MPLTLQAVSTPNKSLIGTNCIYAAAGDLSALGVQDGGFIQVKSMVFTVHADVGVEAGALAFNLVQRKSLQLSLNEPLSVAPWFPPRENVFVCKLRVEADFPNKARATTNPVDAEQLGKYAAKIFQQQCVSVSQDILIDFQGESLTLRVTELDIVKGGVKPTADAIATMKVYCCVDLCVSVFAYIHANVFVQRARLSSLSLSLSLFLCLSVCLSVCLSLSLSVCPSVM